MSSSTERAPSFMPCGADVSEDELFRLTPDLLSLLLKDRTTGQNIIWATDSYAHLGAGYRYTDPITVERITGRQGMLIRPRAFKTKADQTGRTKEMAEVFTPSWMCNLQNNLIDEVWFGRRGVFNAECPDDHTWLPTAEPITYPEGRSWRDYVRSTRMEITCGEAPYIASRYDASTGEMIPLSRRIGILDRKLRVVSEQTISSGEWLRMAREAYKHTYAYEWQGDSLLLAREALLVSFVEYYRAKFDRHPNHRSIASIAGIISWNVWQMDGLRGTVPYSCMVELDKRGAPDAVQASLIPAFDREHAPSSCRKDCLFETEGCREARSRGFAGGYCLIRDWSRKDPKTGQNDPAIRFIDLIK